MAIGDAVASIVGTAQTDRQPSSGVEEQLSCVTKSGSTDAVRAHTGANAVAVLLAAANGYNDVSLSRNIAWMITNACFARKEGTTDQAFLTGVQTNV